MENKAVNNFSKHSNKTPKQAIEHWLNIVSTHNPHDIVSLYAPDGILLGTVADNIKKGRSQIMDYFKMFVQKKPCGEIKTILIQENGDMAIVDGTYIFQLVDDSGKEYFLPARFTFVLKVIEEKWLIITHHSSKQPNM